MNTQVEILERLLHLFPVKKVKDHWGKKGKKTDVAKEIAKEAKPDDIKAFAQTHVGLTKQSIYLREHGLALNKLPASVLPGAELVARSIAAGRVEDFYLVDVKFFAVLRFPKAENVELHFKWPVRVVFEKKHFRVHITLMEKNVVSYFPEDRKPLAAGKDMDETGLLLEIYKSLQLNATNGCVDLNKGIKHLWATDVIDSSSSRCKKAKSTVTQSMDKDCLLKRDDLQTYQTMVQAPLLKNLFVFLVKPEDFPPHFVATPTTGEIVISTFSEDANLAENVITEILKYN